LERHKSGALVGPPAIARNAIEVLTALFQSTATATAAALAAAAAPAAATAAAAAWT